MKNKLYFLLLGLLSAGLVLGVTLTRQATAQGKPQRVIVTLDQPSSSQQVRASLASLNGQVIRDLPLVDGLVVLLPNQKAVDKAKSIPQVTRIEPDYQVFALAPPGACSPWPECRKNSDEEDDDPTQPPQVTEWGVDRIDADLAWGSSLGANITIAIIDTGIDKDHSDLEGNIKGGVNYVAKGPSWKSANPQKWDDDNGHGTHVAGIVAAVDNDIGVIGVAPSAHLYGVKVLDNQGSGYVSDVISGIEWSIDNGMQVINLSLGSSSDSDSLHNAVDKAYQAGLVIVAAAGNSGDGDGSTNEIIYPAKYETVIAVAATDKADDTPYWSSEGEELDVAAPGVDIRSTWNDGLYDTISGTSMASPHTAGTVALLLATDVGTHDSDNDSVWDPDEVRTVLQDTAEDLSASDFDNFYGYGLVDAQKAVQ